jgi:hypothetical protein
MKTENQIFSVTFVIFVIILIIGIFASKKSSALNSPIHAMNQFYNKLEGKHANKNNGPTIAVQNRSRCEIVIGRKIQGQIEWASWITPGSTWVIEDKQVTDFCEGTD